MRKIILLTLTFATLLFSCKKKENQVIIKQVKLEKGETFDNFLTKYTTVKSFKNSNSEFILAKKKNSRDRYLFYTKGLKNNIKEMLRFKGNILNIFIADINNDKNKELYITSTPLKGKTYETVKDVDIFGYSLTNDKKAVRIEAKDIDDLKDFNTDKVTLKNNILSRTYIQNNKEYTYRYKLSKNHKLIPEKVK